MAGTYVSGEVLGTLVLLGPEVDVDDLVFGAHLLKAHQHPRHIRRPRRPEHLHRRHCFRSVCSAAMPIAKGRSDVLVSSAEAGSWGVWALGGWRGGEAG